MASGAAHNGLKREKFESLYERYNRREYVHPDPLEFLYGYPETRDREIVGIIASSLAYGAVRQILVSVSKILARIETPSEFVRTCTLEEMMGIFADFKHRFTTGEEISYLLYGLGRVIGKYGSIEGCFMVGMGDGCENVIPGIAYMVDEISGEAGREFGHLLPHPSRKSACKRLNLYLRWMVRRDGVDPGGWDRVGAEKLIVPMDVHMCRICHALDITGARQSSMVGAQKVTEYFRGMVPEDPVKYDFALTRLGIRDELEPGGFIEECRAAG